MTQHSRIERPAEFLLGRTLDGGWTVIEKPRRHQKATGGSFGVGYIVERSDGKRGFLKALDYSFALQLPDTLAFMQAMTSAFLYERDLLERCAKMSRVVTALDHGQIREANWPVPVSYLVFEWAEQDSRIYLHIADELDVAWCLRTLHHAAVGLQQLHSGRIAHHDVKPSNVLVFETDDTKLADLGRSIHSGTPGPWDEHTYPGDQAYAPPEIQYGEGDLRWDSRMAIDMYQLGSLVLFFFTELGANDWLLSQLDTSVHPGAWQGTFAEVLPFVQQAFTEIMEQLSSNLPPELAVTLTEIVRQLCYPDPAFRGHPRNRPHDPHGLERYVSGFNRLARQAELGLIRGLG